MSVVVREEGVIKLYMKGADNIVKKRLAEDQKLNLDA
jgi:magnesium-transporting ATPase (P-type)